MPWYHHTKFKLKFNSQKSENKQICCGIQNWIKISDLPQTGTYFGSYVYVTVVCSLHNLVMSDLKSENLGRKKLGYKKKGQKKLGYSKGLFNLKKKRRKFHMFRIAFITFHTYYCMCLTCKILRIGAIKSRLYQD